MLIYIYLAPLFCLLFSFFVYFSLSLLSLFILSLPLFINLILHILSSKLYVLIYMCVCVLSLLLCFSLKDLRFLIILYISLYFLFLSLSLPSQEILNVVTVHNAHIQAPLPLKHGYSNNVTKTSTTRVLMLLLVTFHLVKTIITCKVR